MTHKTMVHELGFRRLHPLPTAEELRSFYGDEYYEELGGDERRGPELARLRDAMTADGERDWLEQTLYTDVRAHLADLGIEGGRLLDVGCGTGDFLASMQTAGWDVSGTELSASAVLMCRERGLDVARTELRDLDAEPGSFDVVTLFNVLEHVLDPVADLAHVTTLLRSGGIAIVQVPNDFSLLQDAATQHTGHDNWWIAVPDHLSYFDFDSLEHTARACGLEPVLRTCSFPMELFLLLGTDYLGDRDQGPTAHRQRQAVELSLDGATRRALAQSFAAGGMGRNCVVAARA